MVQDYINKIQELIGDKGTIVGSALWKDNPKDIDVVVEDKETALKLSGLGWMWQGNDDAATIKKYGRTFKNKHVYYILIKNGFGIDVFVGTKQ